MPDQSEIMDDLSSLISTDHFDIIPITETWITSADLDIHNLLNNTNYSTFHSMRTEGRGGGVLTLIKSNLNPTRIATDSNLEMVITKIVEPLPLYLINFYNPNSTTTWVDELVDVIINIPARNESTPIILCGDFNSPNWSPH